MTPAVIRTVIFIIGMAVLLKVSYEIGKSSKKQRRK